MGLSNELQRSGNWLFRWRSFLPCFLILLIIGAIWQSGCRWPFHSDAFHEVWEMMCLGVSILGLLVRVYVVGYAPGKTSGRNTHSQVAETLNTTGIYSIVRHPLYMGNFLIGLGVSFVLWVWWLPIIYTLAFCIYYERIMFAEEAFLRKKFGKQFDDWSAITPAIWPRFSLWRPPTLPFSYRNVMRREYSGLMVVIGGHTGLEFVEHLILDHRVVWEVFWTTLIFGGTAAYFLFRTLKKRTKLLDVAGR